MPRMKILVTDGAGYKVAVEGAILWNRFGSAKASSDQRSHYDA